MAKQLTHVRLCPAELSAHTSTSGWCHGRGDRQETCRGESELTCFIKNPAALGQPLFADTNTRIKGMLC